MIASSLIIFLKQKRGQRVTSTAVSSCVVGTTHPVQLPQDLFNKNRAHASVVLMLLVRCQLWPCDFKAGSVNRIARLTNTQTTDRLVQTDWIKLLQQINTDKTSRPALGDQPTTHKLLVQTPDILVQAYTHLSTCTWYAQINSSAEGRTLLFILLASISPNACTSARKFARPQYEPA